jgi:hypothetical protein
MIFRQPGGKGEDLATRASEEGPRRFRVIMKAEAALPLLFIWFIPVVLRKYDGSDAGPISPLSHC